MADALKLPFAGEESSAPISPISSEPQWLLDERLAALRRYQDLPIETEQPVHAVRRPARGALE